MRNVAGRGESVGRRSPAQSTYGGRSTLTTAAGAPSATMRYAPTPAGTNADSPRSSVPRISPSVAQDVDAARERVQRSAAQTPARRWRESASARDARAGSTRSRRTGARPGRTRFGSTMNSCGSSRRRVQRLERPFDVDVAQREAHVVPRTKRRTRAGESRARTRRALRDCRARALRPRAGLPLAAATARGVRVVDDVAGFDGDRVQGVEHGPVGGAQRREPRFDVGPVARRPPAARRSAASSSAGVAPRVARARLEHRLQLVGQRPRRAARASAADRAGRRASFAAQIPASTSAAKPSLIVAPRSASTMT